MEKKKETGIPFEVWKKIGKNSVTLSDEAIKLLNKDYRRDYKKLSSLERTLLDKNYIVKDYYPVVVFVPSEIYKAVDFFGDDYYLNKLKFYYNIHPCAKITQFSLGHFNDICPSFDIEYQTPTKYSFPYSTGTFYNGIQGGNKLCTIDIITPHELELIFGHEYYIKMKLREQYTWYDNKDKWEREFREWEKEDTKKWKEANSKKK